MSRRYRLSLLMGCPAGGVSCTGTCSPCRCGALWGACLLCRPPALPPRCLVGWRGCFGRLPTPPLVYFPAPSPQPPSPPGKGEIFLFSYARGSAPCIPGIKPPAALTEPAKQVPSGELLPLRHLFALPRGRGPSQTPKFLSPGPPSPWLPALPIERRFCRFCAELEIPKAHPRRVRGSPPSPVPRGFSPGDARGGAPCIK